MRRWRRASRPRRRGASAARSRRGARTSSSARANPTPSSCSSARRRASTRTAGVAVRRTRRRAARAAPRRVGLSLDDAYLATVLKCRPPGNRDPLPAETAACEPLPLPAARAHPADASSRRSAASPPQLLSGRALGITRVHGQEQQVTLGGRTVTSIRSTTRPRRSTRRRCSRCSSGTSRGSPTLLGASATAPSRVVESRARSRVDAASRARRPVQLGLF